MPPVIIVPIHGSLTQRCALLRDNKTWSTRAVRDGLNLVHCRRLKAISLKGNFSPVLDFCSLSLSAIFVSIYTLSHTMALVASSVGHPSCLTRLRPGGHPFHNPFESYLLSVIMVHSGKRHLSRERRDNRLHPPVGLAMEMASEPFNPSPAHEVGPSVGSGRKPRPNSAFQTTHFKFQRNLHSPLVTTHITLILSEEENLVSPLACIAPDPSPGSENSSGSDSKENWEKEKYEQEAFLKDLPPLDDRTCS